MANKDVYLVIGGSGFVGRHIVEQLLRRNDTVSVLDIVQRYHDVPFYSADISDQEQVSTALRRSGTTCIIHTASPPAGLKDPALYWRVNVDGTKAIIAAAVQNKVRKLVFTSSAGVIFDGAPLVNADERLLPPKRPLDAYNESKQKAEEAVLAANGKDGLLTVALRPAGIFGPGDRQVMTGFYKVYEDGKTHFQVGDNNNLFDWTYVENVAYAHLLAADKLDTSPPAPPFSTLEKIPLDAPPLTESEMDILSHPLPPLDHTVGRHVVPTSAARPLGPCVTPPPDADNLVAAFEDKLTHPEGRPVVRTRFDPLSEHNLFRAKFSNPEISPLQVAGQVFIITNGEPCYFWDMPRLVWRHLDTMFPGHRQKRGYLVLPATVGLAFAYAAECWGWLIGKEPALTKYKVHYSCTDRWFNIEKARRVLGYEPQVGLAEGVQKMVDWWRTEYTSGTHKTAH